VSPRLAYGSGTPSASATTDERGFASQLRAAFYEGAGARADDQPRNARVERYEDEDLRTAFRVGWDKADAELRETS
jgi:hypothetical protein